MNYFDFMFESECGVQKGQASELNAEQKKQIKEVFLECFAATLTLH